MKTYIPQFVRDRISEEKNRRRIRRIVWSFGIDGSDADNLIHEGEEMRRMGYSYKQIEKVLEEKASLRGLI